MPEEFPKQELNENSALPEVPPTTSPSSKPQPVELVFDEGDAFFDKKTDV